MWNDHCRIGSLEIRWELVYLLLTDHCRIGSLENQKWAFFHIDKDHCRIGSLETTAAELYADC